MLLCCTLMAICRHIELATRHASIRPNAWSVRTRQGRSPGPVSFTRCSLCTVGSFGGASAVSGLSPTSSTRVHFHSMPMFLTEHPRSRILRCSLEVPRLSPLQLPSEKIPGFILLQSFRSKQKGFNAEPNTDMRCRQNERTQRTSGHFPRNQTRVAARRTARQMSR